MAAQSPAQLRAPTGQDVLFSGSGRAAAGGRVRGRAGARQLVRDAAARVRRGFGDAPAAPGARGRVLHQPRPGAPAGPARAAGRHRPRPRDALGDRPGQGRGDPAVQAARAAPVRRGGGRAGQVPAAPGAGRDRRWCGSPPSSNAPATWSARCKARLRPLSMQATAAERAAKLGGEIAAGRVAAALVGDARRAACQRWACERPRERRPPQTGGGRGEAGRDWPPAARRPSPS